MRVMHQGATPSHVFSRAPGRTLPVVARAVGAEIWDTEAWNTYYENAESDFVNTTEEVIPGLF